jgi:nitrite reductase/ring-hydroxylating ferredoxin subunit/DMSO/TMAO reductase YedYZ heme-binding membrane subunit
MSARYKAVQWSPYKGRYDLVLAGGVLAYLAIFLASGLLAAPRGRAVGLEPALIRALGTAAIILLHITLAIGPACRIWPIFLPLLYNRRHMGVTTFALASAHGLLALGYYHGFGVINPLVSLLAGNTRYTSLAGFPFEVLGVFAWLILLVMAATSHDFWLKNLTPRVWKGIHMLVYLAWGMVVLHVVLGALQRDVSLLYPVALLAGGAALVALHIAASVRATARDSATMPSASPSLPQGWLDAGPADRIPGGRAIAVDLPDGSRAAVFRHSGGLSAITDACAHQGGPLSEGKIIDGCITCPWHGYQYRPADGCAPPPFTERLPTFRLRIEAGRVLLDPTPQPAGTFLAPAREEVPAGREVEVSHAG